MVEMDVICLLGNETSTGAEIYMRKNAKESEAAVAAADESMVSC